MVQKHAYFYRNKFIHDSMQAAISIVIFKYTILHVLILPYPNNFTYPAQVTLVLQDTL